ncbi:hypothetical protein, partial [Acutalibacter intestini]|uniref:hypothetical protein n=1 Tax=Acutalibacter intestini TaxID=3093659 RepID=UPI002AC8E3B8
RISLITFIHLCVGSSIIPLGLFVFSSIRFFPIFRRRSNIKKDLENATKPFYKTVRETDNEHFGMGRLLLRHSGSNSSKPRPNSSEKSKTVSLHGLVKVIIIKAGGVRYG